MNTRIQSKALVIGLLPASIKYLSCKTPRAKRLMRLLLKGHWTLEERAELVVLLRRLSDISPYLIALALPGSFLMLPVLGWWLYWRRNRRRPEQWSE